jgi:hypothetical protein
MGKLDVGVGDEFPVDEPPPPSPETEEAVRAAHEEWHRQRDEWRQRKDEWRQQRDAGRDEWRQRKEDLRRDRDAWREDMRARRDAFKADLKRSFVENFGPRSGYRGHPFFLRLGVVIGIVVLAIALLPFLLMFGFVVMAVVLFFAANRGRRGDYPPGRPST